MEKHHLLSKISAWFEWRDLVVTLFTGLMLSWMVLIVWRGFGQIEEVSITPLQHMTVSQVVSQILPQKLGEKKIYSSLDNLSKRIQSLAWVNAWEIERVWPNQLKVRLYERVPMAQIDDRWVMDDHGAVFEPPADTMPHNMYVIYREDQDDFSKMQDVYQYINVVQNSIDALHRGIGKVTIDRSGLIEIKCKDWVKIELGDHFDRERAERVNKVLAYLDDKKVKYRLVDMRYEQGFTIE